MKCCDRDSDKSAISVRQDQKKNYLKGLERWSDLPHEQILSRREERRGGRDLNDEAPLIILLASGSAAL